MYFGWGFTAAVFIIIGMLFLNFFLAKVTA